VKCFYSEFTLSGAVLEQDSLLCSADVRMDGSVNKWLCLELRKKL